MNPGYVLRIIYCRPRGVGKINLSCSYRSVCGQFVRPPAGAVEKVRKPVSHAFDVIPLTYLQGWSSASCAVDLLSLDGVQIDRQSRTSRNTHGSCRQSAELLKPNRLNDPTMIDSKRMAECLTDRCHRSSRHSHESFSAAVRCASQQWHLNLQHRYPDCSRSLQ